MHDNKNKPDGQENPHSSSLDELSFAAAMASCLPDGVVETENPFSPLDYTLLDPMDMYAADHLILNAITHARENMERDGCLYVIFGEVHLCSSHVMLQAGAVENISQKFNETEDQRWKALLALEYPYNSLASFLKIKDKRKYSAHSKDTNGLLFSKRFISNSRVHAREENCRLLSQALVSRTSLALVDAARKEERGHRFLDENDLSAKWLAWKHFGVDISEKDFCATQGHKESGVTGIEIRNAIMATRINRASSENEARVVIARTGLKHLGNKIEGLSFSTSLQNFLAEKIKEDDRILTVFPACSRFKVEEVVPENENGKITPLFLRNVSEEFHPKEEANPTREGQFIFDLGKSYNKANRGADIPARFYPLLRMDPSVVEKDSAEFKRSLGII